MKPNFKLYLKKWHFTFMRWCEGQSVILVRRVFWISQLISSKPETRKVCSLIKAGKAFQRNGAPDRCREQTGRLQLYVDEVAHKMLLLSSWLILVCDEDKLNFNLRANFYPKAYRHKKKGSKYHIYIFTWEKRSTWNTVHKIAMMVIILYISLWRSLIKPAMSLLLVVVVTGSTSGA